MKDSKRPTTFKASEIFNNNQVDIDIIRGNAEELEEDTIKAEIALAQTIADIFFKPFGKTIQQQFIEFLKKEEVIERYKRNWLFCDWYEYEQPIKKRGLYVLRGFLWASSPEGHDFWSEINNKWLEYMENKGV